MKLVLATGGTGGHVFPAQAFAQALKEHFDITISIDRRGFKYIASNSTYPIILLPFPKPHGGFLAKLKRLFSHLKNTSYMLVSFLRVRPNAVILFGGYVTFPVAAAALLLRIPIIIHEQNIVLGRVNRLFANFARLITTNFPQTLKLLPKARDKVHYIGLTLKEELSKNPKYLIPKIYTPDNPQLRIMILGGSQGSLVLSDVFPRACKLLPNEIQKRFSITHQVRPESVDHIKSLYAETKVECCVQSFFYNTAELFGEHHIIISRSGAATVSEILFFKKPSILVPLGIAADNHQEYNARYLAEKRASLIYNEKELSDTKVARLLEKLVLSNLCYYMQNNAYKRLNDAPIDPDQLRHLVTTVAD